MKQIATLLVVATLVGCASASVVDQAISKLKAGMTEAQARAVLKPHTLDTGTVYWGGSGARRIYFHVSEGEQIWIEMEGGPDGRVSAIGRRERKQKWTRHRGDSITVEDGPTTKSTLSPEAAPSASPDER